MKSSKIHRVTVLFMAAAAALALATPAQAVLIDVEFGSNGNQYSFVREGSTPTGSGDPDDYLRFLDGDTLSLELSGSLLTLAAGPQAFSLASNNGAMATLEFLDLSLDLNDTDGFLGGTMQYSLDGSVGVFSFPNSNFGTFPFNSSSFDGSLFELYLWGGDDANNLGIDFGVTGVAVSEPATLALLSLGLLGALLARRRRFA